MFVNSIFRVLRIHYFYFHSSKTGRNSTVKRNTSLNEKKVRESEGSIVTTTKSPFKITIRTSSNGVTSAGKGKAGNLRRPRTTTAKPGEAIKPEKDEVLNGREYLNETQSNETETKTTKVIFQLLPGKRWDYVMKLCLYWISSSIIDLKLFECVKRLKFTSKNMSVMYSLLWMFH